MSQILRLLGICALAAASVPAGAAPRIFFSDLESGPGSGGEKGAGAFVTIFGKGFGPVRASSSVTVGGGRIDVYRAWTDTRITFQLGPNARTGDIVVTTAGGASNAVPFTVRSGNIYFVGAKGNDGGNGSFAAPWRTLLKAREAIAPGDIVYAMDGVSQTADDGQGWSAAFTLRSAWCGGAVPRALVAYPGATVTIGGASAPAHGIRGVDYSASGGACTGSWVIAGLVIRGGQTAISLWGPSTNWRIVGNDISCPNANGPAGCVGTVLTSRIRFLGNKIHHAGRVGASALYQGLYLGSDTNDAEVGWNAISDVRGCRGIQVYSHSLGSAAPDSGRNQYGLSIHDNLIHDTQCDGVVLYTVDPSKGKVEAYNNVIYNAGLGNPPERTGNWSCINVVGATNYGSPGGGTVEVFQNTLYNCGTNPSPPYSAAVSALSYGGRNPDLTVRLRNNIVYQSRGVPYLVNLGSKGNVTGSNNLFFGNGAPPSNGGLMQSLNSDPLFFNLAERDFHLSAGSPARRAGTATGAATDMEGLARGGDSGYDLGAFQYLRPAIAAFACSPAFIVTPGSTSCTVAVNGDSASGVVELANVGENPGIVLPAGVEVSSGPGGVRFQIEAALVSARVLATVSAVLGDSSGFFDLWLLPANSPALQSVLNAASFVPGPIAPGSIIALLGLNLGGETGTAAALEGGRFGTALAGTTVWLDDTPAPLLFARHDQLNAVVPFAIRTKSVARIEVEFNGMRSNPLPVEVGATSPGIFTAGFGGSGQAVAVNEDGTLNSPAHPARGGSVLTFYADGLGETSPPGEDGTPAAGEPLPLATAAVSVSVGGLAAELLYDGGAPGFVSGLFQINIRLPGRFDAAGSVALALQAGSLESQPGVTVAVE